MTDREQVEYSELRATIRERGTARVYIFAGGFAAWGGLTVAVAALASTPLGTLLPLVVLAAISEAVFALHVAVERVGRYLQVFYEADLQSRSWENSAMAFGRPPGAAFADPLFTVLFLIAAAVNLSPSLVVEPTRAELVFVGGAHALFVLRLATARRAARRQRPIDLERFQALKHSP